MVRRPSARRDREVGSTASRQGCRLLKSEFEQRLARDAYFFALLYDGGSGTGQRANGRPLACVPCNAADNRAQTCAAHYALSGSPTTVFSAHLVVAAENRISRTADDDLGELQLQLGFPGHAPCFLRLSESPEDFAARRSDHNSPHLNVGLETRGKARSHRILAGIHGVDHAHKELRSCGYRDHLPLPASRLRQGYSGAGKQYGCESSSAVFCRISHRFLLYSTLRGYLDAVCTVGSSAEI